MNDQWVKVLRNWIIGFLSVLALIWLIQQLSTVLAPFIGAAIVAYILNPLVTYATRLHYKSFRLPRTIASALAMILLILMVVGLVFIVIPVIKTEINLLQSRLPSLLEQINTVWIPWIELHLGIHLNINLNSFKVWLSQLSAGDEIVNYFLNAIKSGSVAILGFIGNLILAGILSYYFLTDWPALIHRVHELLPRRSETTLDMFMKESDAVLGQYLRGQVAVMLALSVYYSSALWLAGFDVALPVGVLTGLLVVVPYLGYALGLILALLAAVLQFDGINGLIWVAVIYGCGQALESFVLTPRWVGASLGLHPAAVIFALLAFGQLLGFVGVLLALPLSAILVVIGKHALLRYKHSDWYQRRD